MDKDVSSKNSLVKELALLKEKIRDQEARLEHRRDKIKELIASLRANDASYEVRQLTNIVESLLKRYCYDIPLPPENLRLNVGTKTTASNFWAQGMSSSARVL